MSLLQEVFPYIVLGALVYYICSFLEKVVLNNPDLKIGENGDYMWRWYFIPRNPLFNIYVHKFMNDDDDRALHDHPWWSLSFLLKGNLTEVTNEELFHHGQSFKRLKFTPIIWIFPKIRSAKFAHRLILESDCAWTIFITGPVVRSWGFHCPERWVPWKEFTDESGTKTGRGCGES